MKAYNRNYVLYKGSTFLQYIFLFEIYIDLNVLDTPVITGGAKLQSDSSIYFPIHTNISEENTLLTLDISPEDTKAIALAGIYNYAIDLFVNGVITTILEGEIIVKEDVSEQGE